MTLELPRSASDNPIADLEQIVLALKKGGIHGLVVCALAEDGQGYTLMYGAAGQALTQLQRLMAEESRGPLILR